MHAGKIVAGVATVVCLGLGGVATSHARVDSLLYLLERAWQQRDGGNVSIVHTAIVELMIVAPEEMIRWLHAKEEIRADLIEHWQNTVFTDYSGTKAVDLQAMKHQATRAVERCVCAGGGMQMLRKKVLEALARISIRRID